MLLFSLPEPMQYRLLAPASFVLSMLGLVAVALLPQRRWWTVRGLGVLAMAGGLAALSPGRPPSRATFDPRSGQPVLAPPIEQRLLVVGIDGADWTFMDKLLARGELPHVAALRRRGAWGDLKTILPTLSPIVWTTIVTGQPPARHGIQGFTERRLRGIDAPLLAIRPTNDLGFPLLYERLRRGAVIHESLVTSASRRAPAFWNIATAHRSPVNVVSWWATWPAEPIFGFMATDRLYWAPLDERGLPRAPNQVTYPDALYRELAPLVMRPAQVTIGDARAFMEVTPEQFEAMKAAPLHQPRATIRSEFKYFLSMFETSRRVALALIEKGRGRYNVAPDTLVLFRLVDNTCHMSLHPSELAEAEAQDPPQAVAPYGRVVSEAYRRVDRALGELLAAFGEGNVVVLSDHGFDLEPYRGTRRYNHSQGPDGIFLAAGPAFRPGPVANLTVYDMMPLLLAIKGFAAADNLAARVPERVLAPGYLARHPVRHVASFGPFSGLATPQEVPAVESEMLERLRALGYVQ